jgi:uncharacterized protein
MILARTVAAALLIAACTSSDAEIVEGGAVMSFDTTLVHVSAGKDTFTFVAEIARTPEQKTMGLMERRSLADTAAMIFPYTSDQPADAGFWMFRTRIPLQIAYADSTGRIVAIRDMVPCTATLIAGCPAYAPGHPYRTALEVNAGALTRRGIGVGARLWTP